MQSFVGRVKTNPETGKHKSCAEELGKEIKQPTKTKTSQQEDMQPPNQTAFKYTIFFVFFFFLLQQQQKKLLLCAGESQTLLMARQPAAEQPLKNEVESLWGSAGPVCSHPSETAHVLLTEPSEHLWCLMITTDNCKGNTVVDFVFWT